MGGPSLIVIGTCEDWLLALPADSLTGIWFGRSANSFHCSYHGGELFHLACLLLALSSHLLEECFVGAATVDGGGAGGKIADD